MSLSEAAWDELKLGLLGRVWHLYLWKIVLWDGICHKMGVGENISHSGLALRRVQVWILKINSCIIFLSLKPSRLHFVQLGTGPCSPGFPKR